MGVRVFIRSDSPTKSLAEIRSRLPASIIGKGSRTNSILDLIDAAYGVPYFMAGGGVIGRGVMGPGFDIVPSDVDAKGAKIRRKRILSFFSYVPEDKRNIKDTFGPLAKLYTTALMYSQFGQAAWEIIWDRGDGAPLGFDLIPGVLKPNIEADGTFKNPAYVQYIRDGNYESKAEYNDPEDVIFFSVPDFSSGVWLAGNLSLSDNTLPSEIYAAQAYKSLHENRNAPYSGFWWAPEDISDDAWDKLIAMIERRYTGASNYGKNPIVMRGRGGFDAISVPREDAPYIEGRDLNRKEMSATTGVPSPKYGVGIEQVSSTALKELRREFYESTLKPVMSLMEEVIYLQVCIRLFDAPEWRFRFNRPDFTTAVEDASIELRRIQWGQWSPNEARRSRGEPPRDDGDYYLVPTNMVMQDAKPGRPDNEPIDEDEGSMKPGEEDQVPDAMAPERVEEAFGELKTWRRFALRVAKGQRYRREFIPESLPRKVYKFVQGILDEIGDDADGINALFDDVLSGLKELTSEGSA